MFDPQHIWKSKSLPSLPAVAIKLLDLTRDPDTEMHQIVSLIKTDPAICAKLLQATNSSFFGFSSRVTSIDRAVPLLGTTVVTSLALSFSLASDSINSGPMQNYYRAYWRQSIVHAVAGEAIGKRCSKGLECEYFLAGLMMDIGRLAMLKSVSRDYYPVLITADSQERPLDEVEREFLQLDHGEVSYKLMENWKFPENLKEGVKYQHSPLSHVFNELDMKSHPLEIAMVLANAIGDYFMSSASGVALDRMQKVTDKFFHFDAVDLEKLLVEIRHRVEQAGELFAVDMSDLGDPSDLMAQANLQLVNLTMRTNEEKKQIAAQHELAENEKKRLEFQNQELQEKVTRDALTGVFNRAYFDESVEREINESKDRCQPVGVIFTDIDKFKTLNDTYGHQFGDEVLKRFARVIAKNLRSTDILARYGGEEFVILVNRPTEKGIEKLAERIRAAVEAEVIEHQGGLVPVTSSFGVAISIPQRRIDHFQEELLRQADEAMYDSKHNGRNRVTLRCLFSDQEKELLKAINQAKFSRWLVNQEILDIQAVSRMLLQVQPDTRSLGEIAVQFHLLETAQAEFISQIQQSQPDKRFGEIAIDEKLMTSNQLTYLLAWQTEPPERLTQAMIASKLFSQDRVQLMYEQYRQSCDTLVNV